MDILASVEKPATSLDMAPGSQLSVQIIDICPRHPGVEEDPRMTRRQSQVTPLCWQTGFALCYLTLIGVILWKLTTLENSLDHTTAVFRQNTQSTHDAVASTRLLSLPITQELGDGTSSIGLARRGVFDTFLYTQYPWYTTERTFALPSIASFRTLSDDDAVVGCSPHRIPQAADRQGHG